MSELETTSLSSLSDGEWSALSNRWAHGIDWCVSKVGKKWLASEAFGRFPLFKTKKAAYEAVTTLVTWEARCRAARNPDSKTNADLGLCPCKPKPRRQCAKCPWKASTDPHDIPDGYSEEAHAKLTTDPGAPEEIFYFDGIEVDITGTWARYERRVAPAPASGS